MRTFIPYILGYCLMPALFLPIFATGQVKVWEEEMTIPTWQIGPPEVNPTFRWSGKNVYPYPLKEIILSSKADQTYKACWLENEFIKVLVLPQIGGRLHGAKDKTNDYNFFYWQPTIKPALVGMTGAWISGGVEWNFPHGHRPSGFSPVSYRLQENPDGSKTVWVGETEWVYRMRWIVGLTVYPGRSVIEAKVRLSNITPLPHGFQMWATTAVNANEGYQALYPTRVMTGHRKHEFYHWPINREVDISWWKNIPNASSFFAVEPGNFFGGYDHQKDAGTVITGDPRIVIGKKLWTWGTAPLGQMWETILTEDQGPYFEPQAGAYSDNQPDNHWIEPGEVKAYSHFFYPVRDIGAFKEANVEGALNLEFEADQIRIGVYATRRLSDARVLLTAPNRVIWEDTVNLDPSKPLVRNLTIQEAAEHQFSTTLTLLDSNGKELISYTPEPNEEIPLPQPLQTPLPPAEIETNDELWHAGDIAYKFNEFSRAASYFEEAVHRDPGDTRSRISLAQMAIEKAEYDRALEHLNIAQKRDPDRAEIFYLRAVAEERLGNYGRAYDHYFRAVHFEKYLTQGYERIARLDLRRDDLEMAVEHSTRALEENPSRPQLWTLQATALRRLGRPAEAAQAVEKALALDPLNWWAQNEKLALKSGNNSGKTQGLLTNLLRDEDQCYIELALEYDNCGLFREALNVLDHRSKKLGALASYYKAFFLHQLQPEASEEAFHTAASLPIDNEFAFRSEAIEVLGTALSINPQDGQAHYFLGLVYGGKGNIEKATEHWQEAVLLNPGNSRAFRDLGLAYWIEKEDLARAKMVYERAFALAPEDSRILMELDSVRNALGDSAGSRLAFLKKHRKTVESRDGLLTSMLDLMVQQGDYKEALDYYANHHFHNWEGGYGIHNAFMEANIGLARASSDPEEALKHYLKATEYPANLEVAPREPNLRGYLYYPMAGLYRQLGNREEAVRLLELTARESTETPTLASYYQALALRELAQNLRSEKILKSLEEEARQLVQGQGTLRGEPEFKQALGHYYLSKVYEVRGESNLARKELRSAHELAPRIERRALVQAQVSYARASQ